MTRPAVLLLVAAACLSGGCAALTNPVADAVPVRRLPEGVLARPKSELRPVPLTALRQREPDQYRVDKGDVLAVTAENVLGPETLPGQPAQPPPVHLPDQVNPNPSTGYPVPVNDDGTISLPRVPPLKVAGMTLTEVDQQVRKAITGQLPGYPTLIKPGMERVSVQLLQKRRYQVLVVREDSAAPALPSYGSGFGGPIIGGLRKGSGFNLNLPAYENDVLHALNGTGGLPGLDAKNEVIILRGVYDPNAPGLGCPPPGDPARSAAGVIRIPLRAYPEQLPTIREEDIILQNGDIVLIEARDTEVYYTSGLVGGGQWPLPRDYDLDVIEALAQVRAPLLNGSFSQNALVGQAVQAGIGFPNPSLVVVLRQLPGRRQLPIRVDLNRAFRDPRERILIQPGDILVLQERPSEAITRYFTQTLRFNTSAETIKQGTLLQTFNSSNP